MCQQGMGIAKAFSLQAPELVPGVLRALCAKYSYRRLDACAGLMERLGPQLTGIFSEMNLEGSDGYYACAYSFPGSCPVPLHQPKPIEFPKPKPANAQQPAPSGETIQVLHFSDWHLDPLYRPGSEAACSHNICCRDYGRWNDPGPIKKPASKWGDGRCDTPIALGLSALEAIPKFVPNASFGLFTGDIASHDSWMITEKYIADEETRSYELFKQYLQDLRLLYDHVAGIWEKNNWINSVEAEYARSHNAMFMTRPMPGLKLITLNTDLYYVRNFFTMLDTEQDDPSGMFHDLVLELQDSEDRNERVWIMGHMAPITRTLPRSSLLFQKIVARYSPHVIAGIFTGHYHQDKFFVVHDPDASEQSETSAVNVVYQGPSITPLDRSNPNLPFHDKAIRWYDIDAKTFSVLNSHTVIADIVGEAAYWEANDMEPEWKLVYSAREIYSDPELPIALDEPLSPIFWHRAVERMKEDRDLFEKYLQYESKMSGDTKPCQKGSVCEMESLCQMQASTVVKHQTCTAEAVETRGVKTARKKPNKKEPFGVTRAGKEIRLEDYNEQRGVNIGEGVIRRDLWMPRKRRLGW
ncbi:hypothetical protein BGZ65_005394 [Modicella reniformis]|uniref:Sphingomyelin phosphodiesterase n=1 Tax=Modicella reniformis TaxID=1440133 RepID=A0A9P6M8K3_9FUNG|nr:hypothetical protein BGZ65_005394 [Modicella reniformis]